MQNILGYIAPPWDIWYPPHTQYIMYPHAKYPSIFCTPSMLMITMLQVTQFPCGIVDYHV